MSAVKAGAALGAAAFALGLSLAGPQTGIASAAPADTGSARSDGAASAPQPATRGKVTRGSVPKRTASANPAPNNPVPNNSVPNNSAPAASTPNRAAAVVPAVTPVAAQGNSDTTPVARTAPSVVLAAPMSTSAPAAARQIAPVEIPTTATPVVSVSSMSTTSTPAVARSWAAASVIPQVFRAAARAVAAPASATALTGGLAASAVAANAVTGSASPGGDFVGGALQLFLRKFLNKAPSATAKVAMVQSSGLVWGFVSGTDPEGDPLTYTVKKAPQHGSVTIDENGVFTYSPGSGYSGPDTFTAVVSDGSFHFNLFNRKNVVKVTVNTAADPAGTVVDNFNGAAGSQPNPSLWTITTGQWIDSGVQTYTNSTDNVRLDGQGHLVLQALNGADGYTSGEVLTKGRLDTTYGSTTARIQFPTGQGIWPAFWMLGSTYSHDTWNAVGPTGWPGAGEIDIMELVNNGRTYNIALHGPQISDGKDYYSAAGNGDFVGARGSISDLTTAYHDYWVMRAPDLIVIGVDDTKLAEFTPASLPADGQWVFNQPMYTTLNLAVGGAWPGPPDATTPWPSTMLVDSFKYTPLS